MREMNFRLRFKHKGTGQVVTVIADLESLIDGCEQDKQYGFELISKDMYTGLKDKNGIEIYEGDIINDSFGNRKGKIRYNVHTASFEITDYDGIHLLSSGNSEKFFEVIGNTNENGELLKGEHKHE